MKSKNTTALFFGLFIFCPIMLFGQAVSNLDEIHRLIGMSADKISGQLPAGVDSISLKITTPTSYDILKGRITSAFSGKNILMTASEKTTGNSIEYNLEEVKVNYNEMFRDGFLGSFQVERETNIRGSFLVVKSNIVETTDNFNLSLKDTVYVDEINSLENPALPFTHSELPDEPFLSGLWEPVIAVGSSVVAIILFFTVRSK